MPGKKALHPMVILEIKRDTNSKPVRFKAKLIVLGNLQWLTGEYAELYAPVARTELIRVPLAVAEILGLDVELAIVKDLIEHATLLSSYEIYVQLPFLECSPSISALIV